jgi:transcriptional regulator with XRE-family HTH domain
MWRRVWFDMHVSRGSPQRAGLSREYVARLETGQHNPSLATLQKLAKALGVPVTALLE